MGKLVQLIGSGVSMATEYSAYRKANKASKAVGSPSASSSPTHGESSPSVHQDYPSDPPPEYVELPPAQADALIAQGHARPVDQKLPLTDEKKGSHRDRQDSFGPPSSGIERDEDDWALDDAVEAQTGRESPDDNTAEQQNEAQVFDAFMSHHRPPTYLGQTSRPAAAGLPCPVIIPQRRPGEKKRGFVRAYAPVLADVGIDQATFLDFITAFHEASKASPWLDVVNLAAAGAGFAPSAIAQITSAAVQATVGVAVEVQSRSRTNSFLTKMNANFFKPYGLYCVIVAYQPDSPAAHGTVDVSKSMGALKNFGSGVVKDRFHNLRTSSGAIHGELEMPETAPLVFPDLGVPDATTGQIPTPGTRGFFSDYRDRRAQANFARENPDNQLAASRPPTFRSKYADPSHPMYRGDLISLVTAGKMSGGGGGAAAGGGRRGGLGSLLNNNSNHSSNNVGSYDQRPGEDTRRGSNSSNSTNGVRRERSTKSRIFQKDVLYLMIVNLPTEEELKAGRLYVAKQAQPQPLPGAGTQSPPPPPGWSPDAAYMTPAGAYPPPPPAPYNQQIGYQPGYPQDYYQQQDIYQHQPQNYQQLSSASYQHGYPPNQPNPQGSYRY